MEERKAVEILNTHINKYIPGAYFGGFTNSKRVLGAACNSSIKGQFIKLSKYMLKIVSDEEVIDTIAHECAHILALRKFGTFKHDRYFYQMCHVTGARPERLSNNDSLKKKIKEDSSYTMVVVKDGMVVRLTNNSYLRRPRKCLKGVYLISDKKNTLGNLYYCKKEDAFVGKKIDNGLFWQ